MPTTHGAERATPSPVRFLLLADASPGLLPRVLQPLARRDLTPDSVLARRIGDCVEAEVVVTPESLTDAALIEGNLRQIVGVRSVTRVPVNRAQAA
jgi:hypothetical protein